MAELDSSSRALAPQEHPFTSEAVLTDGGVHDNLGLEAVWRRCETVLVSDAGGQTEAEADWASLGTPIES